MVTRSVTKYVRWLQIVKLVSKPAGMWKTLTYGDQVSY